MIPALISRRIASGADATEAFRASVASFEGSVAIAAAVADEPGRCSSRCGAAARRSTSGAPTTRTWSRASRTGWSRSHPPTCASTARRCARPATPRARARSSCSTRAPAAIPGAITRRSYDGTVLPIEPDEWVRAEITTRDVDRGDAPHYLLKEITEAPGVVPQDAAGQARRARRRLRRPARAGGAARRAAGPPARPVDPAGRRDRSGHRGDRRSEPRDAAAPAPARRGAHGRGGARDRVLGLRPARRHARHARRRHQPERHDDRHEPHRRSRARAARPSSRS